MVTITMPEPLAWVMVVLLTIEAAIAVAQLVKR
jgi:hypothetical protein